LCICLRESRPFEVENGVLKLGFTYKFHYNQLKQAKNWERFCQILEEVLGFQPQIKLVLKEKIQPLDLKLGREGEQQQQQKNPLKNFLDELGGGEIVS